MGRKLYLVGIGTLNVNHAGTDSDVVMTLHGEKGSSSPINLHDSRAKNFDVGNMDLFPYALDDLGRIMSVEIGCGDHGSGFD